MIQMQKALALSLRLCLPVVAAAVLMFTSSGSKAQILISAESVGAAAGTTGDGLDVTLKNLGAAPVTIDAFVFEVTVASTDITLTGVTTGTTTATYIFNGTSLFGPNIGTSPAGQDMAASDIFGGVGSGAVVGAGATAGLGHLVFNVSGSASGSYLVMILPFPNTSLSDVNGGNIDFVSSNGAIRVTGSGPSVPEPGSVALLAALLVPASLIARRRSSR